MKGEAGPDAAATLRRHLLAWYERHRRDLPWRAPPGVRADPYRVLVSEVMLQQTTVATVRPRFLAFIHRFPTIEALASASVDDVLHAWQGLGYYRRARALHACARVVIERHGGRLPPDPETLERLPGLGAYTARAVAAIAFDRPVIGVDGNVRRVVARLHALERPGAADLADAVLPLAEGGRSGDVTQALMDLGSMVCTPAAPRCLICPWRTGCRGHASGTPERFPARAVKPVRPERAAAVFVLRRGDGAVLFRRRPATGLLGGMHELPSSPWLDAPLDLEAALGHAPAEGDWQPAAGTVRHLFTHFALHLVPLTRTADGPLDPPADGSFWCAPADRHRLALPTVMRKVLRMVEPT